MRVPALSDSSSRHRRVVVLLWRRLAGAVLATARRPPFPAQTRTAPRWRSRSVSASASASLIRSPARQSRMITPRKPHCLKPIPRGSHHRDDRLHARRVRRVPKALGARNPALVKAQQSRGRPVAPSTIQQSYGIHDVLSDDDRTPRPSPDPAVASERVPTAGPADWFQTGTGAPVIRPQRLVAIALVGICAVRPPKALVRSRLHRAAAGCGGG
jgi:hypothetical protein